MVERFRQLLESHVEDEDYTFILELTVEVVFEAVMMKPDWFSQEMRRRAVTLLSSKEYKQYGQLVLALPNPQSETEEPSAVSPTAPSCLPTIRRGQKVGRYGEPHPRRPPVGTHCRSWLLVSSVIQRSGQLRPKPRHT